MRGGGGAPTPPAPFDPFGNLPFGHADPRGKHNPAASQRAKQRARVAKPIRARRAIDAAKGGAARAHKAAVDAGKKFARVSAGQLDTLKAQGANSLAEKWAARQREGAAARAAKKAALDKQRADFAKKLKLPSPKPQPKSQSNQAWRGGSAWIMRDMVDVAGGLGFRGQPFRPGDPPIGSMPRDQIDRLPRVAQLVGFGAGGQGDFTYLDPSQRNGSGSIMVLPTDVDPGRYLRGEVTGSPSGATSRILLPGGMSTVDFADPHPASGGSKSGARIRKDGTGLRIELIDSTGEPIYQPWLSVGEGGVVIAGKLTVTGRLDPTTLEFGDTAADNIPNGAPGLRYDSTTSIRPLWKEKASPYTTHELAFLDDITTGGVPAPDACKVGVTAGVSVGATATQKITFDREVYDTNALHSLTANPSRITVSRAGKYQVEVNCVVYPNTADAIVQLLLNGVTVVAHVTYTSTTVTASVADGVSALLDLSAGDYLEVQVINNGSSSITVGGPNDYQLSLAVQQVGLAWVMQAGGHSVETATNNDVATVVELEHTTSHASNGALGLGSRLGFRLENDAGGTVLAGGVKCVLTTATAGNEFTELRLEGMASGSLIDFLRVTQTDLDPIDDATKKLGSNTTRWHSAYLRFLLQLSDTAAAPVADRQLKCAAGLIRATSTAGTEGRYISKASIEQLAKADLSDAATIQTHDASLDEIAAMAFAKGDVIVSDGTNLQRLPVGADGYVLTADSTVANGVKWAAGGSGGGGAWTKLSVDMTTNSFSYSSPYTYTIPAGQLATDGDVIEIHYFINNISAAGYSIMVKYAGTLIGYWSPASNSYMYALTLRIVRTGASSQRIEFELGTDVNTDTKIDGGVYFEHYELSANNAVANDVQLTTGASWITADSVERQVWYRAV